VDLEEDKGIEEEHKEGPCGSMAILGAEKAADTAQKGYRRNRKDQAVRIADSDIAEDYDIARDYEVAGKSDIAEDYDIARHYEVAGNSEVVDLVDSYFCTNKKSRVPAISVDDLMGVGASWEHSA
jgi:hypothetical protein